MAKKGTSAWNRKFGEIAKRCFKESDSMSKNSYGNCMKTELKAVSNKVKTHTRASKKLSANRRRSRR